MTGGPSDSRSARWDQRRAKVVGRQTGRPDRDCLGCGEELAGGEVGYCGGCSPAGAGPAEDLAGEQLSLFDSR